MAGKIKKIIDQIVQQKSGGNSTLELTTKTKLILKGFNPDNFSPTTEDDPVLIEKLNKLASEMGITL